MTISLKEGAKEDPEGRWKDEGVKKRSHSFSWEKGVEEGKRSPSLPLLYPHPSYTDNINNNCIVTTSTLSLLYLSTCICTACINLNHWSGQCCITLWYQVDFPERKEQGLHSGRGVFGGSLFLPKQPFHDHFLSMEPCFGPISHGIFQGEAYFTREKKRHFGARFWQRKREGTRNILGEVGPERHSRCLSLTPCQLPLSTAIRPPPSLSRCCCFPALPSTIRLLPSTIHCTSCHFYHDVAICQPTSSVLYRHQKN